MTPDEAHVHLCLFAVRGVGPVLLGRILQGLVRDGISLVEAMKDERGHRLLRQWLKEPQLRALLSENSKVAEQVARLKRDGVQLLDLTDPAYPHLLRTSLETPPPLLLFRGNPDLLQQPAVGFCGSRSASEKGIATAEDMADQLARAGVVVVSGHASGVDQATHRAALAAGGGTILVLPEGILHFRLKKALEDVWDWQRVLVLSEFPPGTTWSVGQAMQRNKTILGLTQAQVLIEAGETGGSMAAGKEALAMKRPLYAPVYEGMPPTAVGNRILLEMGARPLMKKRATNRANLEELLQTLSRKPSPDTPIPYQMAL